MTAPAIRYWKIATWFGVGLIELGVAGLNTSHDLIPHQEECLSVCIMGGLALVVAGCIGWCWLLDRRGALQLAGKVFFAPWLIVPVGCAIDGFNVHGMGAVAMMQILLGAALAIILTILALFKRREQPAS